MHIQNSKKAGFIAVAIAITLVIIFAGVFATFKVGAMVSEKQKEKLLVRAENAAILIDADSVKSLQGSDADLSSSSYTDLKEKMMKLKTVNSDARFFYLMGLRETNQLFFFVDSENPTSEDYSAPGDPYNEPAPEEISNFKKGIAYVQNPYTDSWGTWVSASAPIKDTQTGATLAVIGIDIDAHEFQTNVRNASLLVGGITLFLALFLLYLILYIKKSHEQIDFISKHSDDMAVSYSYLKEAETIAELGRFTLNVSNGSMDLDDTAFDVCDLPQVAKPDLELFMSRIDVADRDRVRKIIDEAVVRQLDSFKTNFKIVGESVTKTVLLTGTVRSSQNGKAVRVIGTIQDITGNVA